MNTSIYLLLGWKEDETKLIYVRFEYEEKDNYFLTE